MQRLYTDAYRREVIETVSAFGSFRIDENVESHMFALASQGVPPLQAALKVVSAIRDRETAWDCSDEPWGHLQQRSATMLRSAY